MKILTKIQFLPPSPQNGLGMRFRAKKFVRGSLDHKDQVPMDNFEILCWVQNQPYKPGYALVKIPFI